MRTVRLFAVSALFAAMLAVSAIAQTATVKIGLIDTSRFGDEKEGITKYTAASTSLNAEFKVAITELQTLGNSIDALNKELQGYQEIAQKGQKIPIAETEVQKKLEQLDKLQREAKFKEEDVKARYERRRQILLNPITQDIGVALDEFTKKNGYLMLLDIAKLYDPQNGPLLSHDPTADVTKAFILFYNARPTPAASTVPAPVK